jgi:hypothetical protein
MDLRRRKMFAARCGFVRRGHVALDQYTPAGGALAAIVLLINLYC